MAFTRITQLLMLANSCINPLVYATAIPAFKTLIREPFCCNCKIGSKLNGMKDTTEDPNANEAGTNETPMTIRTK